MENAAPPSKIIGVQFSMLSPEEIRKNSVVEITSRDTYIGNKPVVGGLFDPRMGVLEPGLICPTDGFTYIDTPGYFGHIELARPVFFIQHIKEIVKISKCICFKCSKLRINKNVHRHVLNQNSEDRWHYIQEIASKVKRCGESIEDGCGCKQPDKIKLDGMATLTAVWENMETTDETRESKTVNMRLTPEIVLKIFKRISDEDITFMGFSPLWSRPEWMVCQVLPVPPPAVRPSVKHDAQQRSEDDLTHIYMNIIKTNKDLKDKINNNASPNVIEGMTIVLQYYIAMIVNNKVKGAVPLAQRSGRPLQCIMSRLNSKNGRIRGNLMGKRVDFSARSVITGDPNLSIQQLGVPRKIAMNITKPVVVNDRNRDFLMMLVQNGPEVYPGAKILERRGGGENISLRYVDRDTIRLENGDVVHRHMMDGDAVLFNRQPSLHRMSMMCHIVKVMEKGDTFRMNVGCTKPYNADFDGDEMNMHLPQNVLAETELRHLAAIPYQMISPSANAPIIGIYQDSLLGSYRFSRPDINFTQRDAMNLLMMFPRVNPTTILKAGDKISNFDILSQILPPLTLKYKTKLFKDSEDAAISNNVLEIRNGQYMRGQMEKSVLASTTKGIIHRVFNDYGNFAAANFIDDLQNIITEYMKSSSFSVGISDLIANKKTQDSIIQVITVQKQEVQTLIEKVHLGTFENNTAATNNAEFEQSVNNILNKATEQSGKKARDSLSKDNRFLMIVESGSKGSLINISQMIACLGQQNVDGKRIPYGFDSRTLPHYSKFDDSPNARGFIENSYISGLTAPELFFHAMGGRIGLIDTAVKTSQTGYIQRRLIKGLEDLKVEYDMTVRNNKGRIVQFAYGDDGFDSTKAENQSLSLVAMTLEDIYLCYDIPGVNDERSDLLAIYAKGAKTRLSKQRKEAQDKCREYIAMMTDYRDQLVSHVFQQKNDNTVRVPVAFPSMIANIHGQLALNKNSILDITPLEAFRLIEEYFDKLTQIYFVPPTTLFRALYFYYLNPKELLIQRRFNKEALTVLLEMVLLKYKQAIVHPGEMVGVIAGQSIGEPTTQLTLNSVTYETEILVRNSKKEIKKIQIGKFTSEQIKCSIKIDYMDDKDTTYAELSDYYEVPSSTENGETVWRRIEAVTQHPVINEDGTNTMLRVITAGNREVIATKAKSFLQLIDGKIQGVNGKSLNVGDYLPVSKKTLEYARLLDLGIIDQTGEEIQTAFTEKDLTVPNIVNGKLVMEERKGRFTDIEFDQIVSIEEVQNTTKYAYDLTVEDTRNFDCYNGLCLRDTFHLSGVASKSNVTRGVPRIEEILRLTKNPKNPSLTVHLKAQDEQDKEKATKYANMLEHTRLLDVIKSVQICFDPLEKSTNILGDRLLLEQYYEFENMVEECLGEETVEGIQKSKWIVRIEMDKELLLDKNITMDDIHFAITTNHGNEISCAYSDYNNDNLVFRIRLNGNAFNKSKKTKSNGDPLDQSDEIYLLRNFQDTLLNNIVLRGINGIVNVAPRKLQNYVVKTEDQFVQKDVWILDTTGTNLMDVLALDYIDSNRTYCNDIKEIYEVLGLEAARQILYNELVEVMEFSDVYINYHHTSLLCDRMCSTQNMVSIFRSGILNDDIGPISKSTFEVHTEVLLNASRHAEFDHMRGVSANIMMGQAGYFGTGSFQLVLDMEEMANLPETGLEKERGDIDEMFGSMEDPTANCSKTKIQIRNNLSAIKKESETMCINTEDGYDAGF
jgi:DNA-directed RNA polymerase II subunit RPB1